MRELIDDGVSGALVSNVEAAVAAVGRVRLLDRARIRARAVELFGVDRMIDDYISVYEHVIADARHA
jgi:glycosyltransferase involved in cell wall biosynthesis